MNRSAHAVVIRPAARGDLPAIVGLAEAHARYERAEIGVAGLADRLADTLVPPVRACCMLAETSRGDVVGYATMAPEYSTWGGSCFAHLDTLYVDERHRGAGIGRRLVEAVIARAAEMGVAELQWQTPVWNADAVRFYERLGATSRSKLRFALQIPAASRHRTAREILDSFTAGWGARDEEAVRACLHPEAVYVPSVALPGAPFVGRERFMRAVTAMWERDGRAAVTFGPVRETFAVATRTWTLRFPDGTERAGIDEFEFADATIIAKTAWSRPRSPVA